MSKSISQLDAITNEAIDLSQFLAIDDPSQTFKLSLLQLRDFFTGQLYPVGSTMFRLDNRTPNDCGFPGTWNKIGADLSLHTASADGSNVGVADGVNAPIVPVTEHNHTASMWTDAVGDHDHIATAVQDPHGHFATTDMQGDHSHTAPIHNMGGTQIPYCLVDSDGDDELMAAGYIGNAGAHVHNLATDIVQSIIYVDVTPAGTHAHTGGVTVNLAGTPGATLDVRGARIMGHLWHRTA